MRGWCEAELSEKLEADIRFTFDRLAAIDINARARAFQGFINGGLTLEAALSLVGLELPPGGAAPVTPADLTVSALLSHHRRNQLCGIPVL